MSPTEFFGAVSGAAGAVKTIGDLFRSGKDKDAEAAMGQLSMTLLQISTTAVAIMEENSRLKEALADKEAAKRLRSALVFDRVYVLREAAEGYQPGVYCPGCFDSGGKLIRLSFNRAFGMPWICSICRLSFHASQNETLGRPE